MGEAGDKGAYEALGVAWSLGWRVAAGAWIGYRVDLWLRSQGLFTLLLALAAMITGVRTLIRAGRVGSARGRGSQPEDDKR